MKNCLFVAGGAIVGGIVGYYIFMWFSRHGHYALALPGGLIGVGAGLGKSKSIVPAIICCAAAIALGFYADWRFEGDASFGSFLQHAADLDTVTLVMIAVGAFVAFWIPFRRREPPSTPTNNPPA